MNERIEAERDRFESKGGKVNRNSHEETERCNKIAAKKGFENNPFLVTNCEAKVIASLLELYDAAWSDGNHKRDCGCQFCAALEAAGEHDFRIFDSLNDKFRPKWKQILPNPAR